MSEVQIQSYESVYEEFLRGVMRYAQEVKTFAEAQIPDVIAQLLMWKMVEHGVYTVIGIMFLTIFVCLTRYCLQQLKITPSNDADGSKYNGRYTRDSWDFKMAVSCVIVPISLILGSLLTLKNIMQVLYILVAPKVYLIEYGANLIK